MTLEDTSPPSKENDHALFASTRSWSIAFVGVIALAIVLRLFGIGQWSFASDELGTFHDVRMFWGENLLDPDDPDRNVPKMIPLAMVLHSSANSLFGKDESGSRRLPAICGIAQIVLVGFGLRKLIGPTESLAVALLLTLSPEHLFYCQYHRFYVVAALFTTIAFLAAAYAFEKSSARWMIVACVAAFTAVLTQSLVGVLFGGFVLAALIIRRRPNVNRVLLAALAGALFAAMFAALYLYPLGKAKAVGYEWAGYSPLRSVLSGISQVTWPVVILALPGIVVLWRHNRTQAAFWGSQAFVWAASLVVLPFVLEFHSAYAFPTCLPVFVLAGVGLAELVNRLASFGKIAALTAFVGLLMLNLPEVASYYQDGSRHDFRAAADWVADSIEPNDALVVVQGDKLSYYRPELTDRWRRLPRKGFEEFVDEHRPPNGKVWIVLPGGRGGLPEPWREWAEKNARIQKTIVHRRFDYHEYPIFILLEDRPKP